MTPTDPAALLPLLSLPAVLVPEAVATLRVVEPQLLDAVRVASRAGRGFGVCLRLEAPEGRAGDAQTRVGTEAHLVDFHSDGVLTVHLRGGRRFQVEAVEVATDDALRTARVGCLHDAPAALRPEHALLADVVRRALEHAGHRLQNADKHCFEDAHWIGWRLVELLPQPEAVRQQLLQQHDPHARLDHLLRLLS